ncbi:MAG: ribosome-associated translation inhibitor RaiA [Gammaproteobacteria bacterium]|nr:ribosome-associated translation inhibitor RaiA [Gammaproteobacteria bacterium]MDH3464584.1 ribosome-associated translation inhibitor RaiA [Gammaproteobacteria bacterium]
MQLTISGQHIDITPPLRSYVSTKIGRIERHFDHVTTTNVVLQVEKTRHMAEATIAARGTTLHANAEANDMYAAIDALANKLDRQVLKHKEKLKNRHKANSASKNVEN